MTFYKFSMTFLFWAGVSRTPLPDTPQLVRTRLIGAVRDATTQVHVPSECAIVLRSWPEVVVPLEAVILTGLLPTWETSSSIFGKQSRKNIIYSHYSSSGVGRFLTSSNSIIGSGSRSGALALPHLTPPSMPIQVVSLVRAKRSHNASIFVLSHEPIYHRYTTHNKSAQRL